MILLRLQIPKVFLAMNFKVSKNRIEAFSDGVIAIIITIMVLELRLPELKDNFSDEEAWDALLTLLPKLFAYLLSFVVVAILWINHHMLFDRLPHATSGLVWYNAFLLFVMSLIPLPTAFLAKNPFLFQAEAFYGLVMFLNALAFFLMRRYIELEAGLIPFNARIQWSNLISTGLYLLSVPLAWFSDYIPYLIFIGIPIWYFLPDRFHSQKT
jgi:uncharacterized membrane protein